jgi:hypothetical protein
MSTKLFSSADLAEMNAFASSTTASLITSAKVDQVHNDTSAARKRQKAYVLKHGRKATHNCK